jgi:hypothetical protein
MFNVGFDVILYDLTSTYFEYDPPESGKRHGNQFCKKWLKNLWNRLGNVAITPAKS